MTRLVIVSGPSCAGKSPLARALAKHHPDLAARLEAPVLHISRPPRPGERDGVDYRFRTRGEIEALRGEPGWIVLDVRRDVQALPLADVRGVLSRGKDALFEGNPYVAAALLDAQELSGMPRASVFLSPLSAEEIAFLLDRAPAEAERIVTDVMRRKLLRRTQRQKGILSAGDLEDIEARCGAAWRELGFACRFDHVFPNHDGEDSENWDAFYFPMGDARRCVESLAAILRGETPSLDRALGRRARPTTRVVRGVIPVGGRAGSGGPPQPPHRARSVREHR